MESAKKYKAQDLSFQIFSLVAVSPFYISEAARQAVHARMGWDHAALYLSRSTHLELLQLRLLAQ